jgi:hypothetical protein
MCYKDVVDLPDRPEIEQAIMRRIQTIVAILALSASALAVDTKTLTIGITIGLGLAGYSGTRTHVLLPTAHAIQRTLRPIPQDRIDAQQRKLAKARRKAAKLGIPQPPDDGTLATFRPLPYQRCISETITDPQGFQTCSNGGYGAPTNVGLECFDTFRLTCPDEPHQGDHQ